MPLSIKMHRSPSSTSRQRIAHVQRFRSSAGFSLFQMVLGTTPNIAPPSSLKKPVLMTLNFMNLCDWDIAQRDWRNPLSWHPMPRSESFFDTAHGTQLVDPLTDPFGWINGRQLARRFFDGLFDLGGHPLHVGMGAPERFTNNSVDEFERKHVFGCQLE